jgi:PAS domain S-box-containing protein
MSPTNDHAYLAAIVESSDDAIISKDLDGTIRSFNAAAEELFGYRADEIIGRPVLVLIPPERQDEEMDILARLRRGERVKHFETVRVTKSGERVDVSLTVSPVRSQSGEIIGASKIARDIREHKRDVAALAAQQEWFRVTLGSIGDAVIASDHDGRVTFLNPEAERLTGWSLPEALQQPLSEVFHIVHEESRKRVENPAEKVLRMGHVVGLANHTALIARNGAEWPIADSAAPIRDHDGNVLGVVLVFREIADLRRGEQQARSAAAERERLLQNERAARSEAERANRVKDDFVAMVSHELRTPLNAILGWIELLKQKNADPALLAHGLEVVGRNTRLQAQLISDLLDVSRIASGKLQLELEAVRLDELVEQSIESFQPAAAEKGIEVEMAIARPVPAMLGDPGRLQQVAWNLLSNAIKFTPNGGNVSVHLRSANEHIELTVTDSGVGIRPELLPNIFERFRQGATTSTRRHGGLGLGLSITKHLVELHGGSISAWSGGDDQGATFTVELPVRSTDQPGTPRGPTEIATAAHIADGVSLDGIRILVVEDDLDTRDLVRRLLESYRAQVTVAASAPEALELMRTGRMDVLLSDIGLPDMDGYDLIRAIRQPGGPDANIPAIALTAFARAEDRTRTLRAGFNAHLAKPVDPTELIVVVGSFLSLISSQRAP